MNVKRSVLKCSPLSAECSWREASDQTKSRAVSERTGEIEQTNARPHAEQQQRQRSDAKQSRRRPHHAARQGRALLVRFDGPEGLSEVFEFSVEAISEQEIIDFDKAIGQQCTVKISNFGRVREFTGILVEAQWMGLSDQGEYYTYRVMLRPWLWLLTHTTDCRVFQEKKAPDIIKQVFKDRGFSSGTDYELKLTDGGYPQRRIYRPIP